MWAQEYKDCLDYINGYWDKIIHKPSSMTVRGRISSHIPKLANRRDFNVIDMPHAYIVPNDKKFNYIFYWDTYFIFKGLLGTKREWVMQEMIKNFIFLYEKYGIIPNFNAPVSLGRSQPPLLTGMIMDAYRSLTDGAGKGISNKLFSIYSSPRNRFWFKKAIETAKKEYYIVWIDELNAYNHHVRDFPLSRYGDRDVGYAQSSELESGWDFTSRFYNRCNNFLPVDLNTYLFKYETDFSAAARILNDKTDEKYWLNKSEERRRVINKLMWSEDAGFFFDYGWYYRQQSEFLSLAGYVPLWAGLATAEQAQKMVKKLQKFETPYGLVITAKESLAKSVYLSKIEHRYHPAIKEILEPKQWDYPNIWSPLEYHTIIGLLRYGFIVEAKRIIKNSLRTNAVLFRKYGTFFEKINAETGEPGTDFHYENQTGFGWTNAIFYRYIQIIDALESGVKIYKQPQSQTPPYELEILH